MRYVNCGLYDREHAPHYTMSAGQRVWCDGDPSSWAEADESETHRDGLFAEGAYDNLRWIEDMKDLGEYDPSWPSENERHWRPENAW